MDAVISLQETRDGGAGRASVVEADKYQFITFNFLAFD